MKNPSSKTYRSKSISLAEDVWEALDKAKAIHGSYNKLFRYWLSAGEVFEPEKPQVETMREIVRRHDVKNLATVATFRKPLLKPKERK